MSPEYKTAIIRGVISAFILAGAQFFVVFAIGDAKVALVSSGATFFGTLASRIGVEGSVDSKRANPPTP